MDTTGYEWVPARLELPAFPLVVPKTLAAKARTVERPEQNLQISGASTVSTSLATALQGRERALKRWQHLARRADVSALIRQLSDHPELIAVAAVREKVSQIVRSGRWNAPRGRPAGRYRWHPLIVRGLVVACINGDPAMTPERAFHRLAEWNFLSYDAAKKLYYQAFDEERFRAVVWESGNPACRAPEDEARSLAAVEQLERGESIRRQVDAPVIGRIDLSFTADL